MPQFPAQIDTMRIPIKGLIPEQSASALPSPVEGLTWHDTVNKHVFTYLNGAWVQLDNVAGGSAPIGPAGGDLTGTYPNPTVAPNAINSSKIQDGTITTSDLAFTPLLSGGTAGGDLTGTYPNPTIATGVVDTGKIKDNTIVTTDLNLASVRLDSIGLPTAPVQLNSQKITGLADPTQPQDAATKAYVDSVAQGLDAKQSVKAASTGNVNTAVNVATLDGVTLNLNDRFLLKNQTNPAENGIYTATAASSGFPVRVADMDAWTEVPSAFTFVEQGTVNADTGWVSTADQGGTIGTTAIPWTQFSGAGSVTAGAGLTQSGTTIDVGSGPGITVNADSIQVANDGITNAMIADGAINLASADVTGILPLTKGGTGADASTAVGKATARQNLGTPGIFFALIPALSPGVYTTVAGIPYTAGGFNPSFATVGGAGPSGGVFFDWRLRDTQQDFQVKADVTISASAYSVTAVEVG